MNQEGGLGALVSAAGGILGSLGYVFFCMLCMLCRLPMCEAADLVLASIHEPALAFGNAALLWWGLLCDVETWWERRWCGIARRRAAVDGARRRLPRGGCRPLDGGGGVPPLPGEAETLFHRLWECPRFEAVRARERRSDPRWAAPWPGGHSRPAGGRRVGCRPLGSAGQGLLAPAAGVAAAASHTDGYIGHPVLARAGWAAVLVDLRGRARGGCTRRGLRALGRTAPGRGGRTLVLRIAGVMPGCSGTSPPYVICLSWCGSCEIMRNPTSCSYMV